ncbi:LysR family transcriptional regulator [Achromobacter sp. ES-001]|uniref:LysR family transcriptional regulator n=1 Tax=Achromobacter sp. ES-001 TaxID=2860286 RepID=UPI001C63ED52|nr:LysR family transcriptional regulator [Achromobacter sp. ES-001]QYJ19265.1 LysR family transcriptional regulator [Achromobacter sp. ES-001]
MRTATATATPGSPSSAATLFNRLIARTRLRHLQLIVLVAELGSVQHAAAQIGLTQSAATKMVLEVERVLEARLFERHARGMRPTFACRDLLPLLRNVMNSLTGCAESLAAAGAGFEGTVRVGAITAGVSGVINPALPEFFARQPQVRLELFEDALPVLLGRYADGELDFLVAREPAQLAPDSQFQALLADICVVASGPRHPLLGRRNLQPADLLAYPWASPPLDSQTYRAFEALFAECGELPPQQPLSTRSFATMVHYLRASQALMMGPLSFVREGLDSGALARLDCTLADTLPPLGLVSRTEPRNRSVAAFQAHLLETHAARRPGSQRAG